VNARHDDLPIEPIEEALMEFTPKLSRYIEVHVQSDDYLGCLKLLESMLDAIAMLAATRTCVCI
jgi:hypothetical protein